MSVLNDRFLGLAGVVPLKPMFHGSNPDLINFTNVDLIKEITENKLDSYEESLFSKKREVNNPFDLKFEYVSKNVPVEERDDDFEDDGYGDSNKFYFELYFKNKKIGYVIYDDYYGYEKITIKNKSFQLNKLVSKNLNESLVDRIYRAFFFTKKGEELFNKLMNLNENVEGSNFESQFVNEIDFYRIKFSNNKQWRFSRLNDPRIGFSLTNYSIQSGFNDIITVEFVNNKISVKYKDNLNRDVKIDDIRKFIQNKTGVFLIL